jgi:hypothetical protein
VSATKAEVVRELKRRARARESLHSFALNVQIPTVPGEPMCPDEDLLGPAANFMARHHAAILATIQRTIERPMGRCVIMAPPGSAKSLYAILGVAWAMGKFPGQRFIYTSYAGNLAEKQSRRAQQIAEQGAYRQLWPGDPVITKDAAAEWHLRHGGSPNPSEMLAMGLMGGLTGNRANGWVIDDPVAGREEADSETTRQKIYDAYKDDLLTRCLPNAWGVLILTRWHADDLAGRILPEDYDGASGIIRGTDGLDWEVLNIPAKAERGDDPLERQPGEYLWPEYYPPTHWAMFENAKGSEAARTWSSLYQQRPTPQGSNRFSMDMFDFYEPGTEPPYMAHVIAIDAAVTEGKNDFTEIGVFGIDPQGDLWERDWFSQQCTSDKWVDAFLDMAARWKCYMGFNEGGVIDKAARPAINKRMREKRIYMDLRSLPSMSDKVAKCMTFQARAASKTVHFRNTANSRRIVQQLIDLPAGRYDDAADVCGLVGRAIDQFPVALVPSPPERKNGPKPFTGGWLEWSESDDKPKVRWR